MVSPTGILPEDLFYPSKIAEVQEYLIKLPLPGDEKVKILVGWSRWVGVKLSPAQRQKVFDSGVG